MVGALTQARGAVLTYQATSKGASLVQGVLNGKLTLAQALWGGLTTSQVAATASLEANEIVVAQETVAMAAEAAATETSTVAHTGLNAVLMANPWSLAIAGILAAGAACIGLAKIMESGQATASKYYKEFEKNAQVRTENAESMKANAEVADVYSQKIEELNQKERLSTREKQELKTYVEGLNDAMGETVATIDEETGKVIESTGAIRDRIAALKQQAEVEVYTENYKQALQEQVDIEMQLEQAVIDRNDAYERASADGVINDAERQTLLAYTKEIEGLTATYDALGTETDKWADKMTQSMEKSSDSAEKGSSDIKKSGNDIVKSLDKTGKDAGDKFEKGLDSGLKKTQKNAKTSSNKVVSNVKGPLSKRIYRHLGTRWAISSQMHLARQNLNRQVKRLAIMLNRVLKRVRLVQNKQA